MPTIVGKTDDSLVLEVSGVPVETEMGQNIKENIAMRFAKSRVTAWAKRNISTDYDIGTVQRVSGNRVTENYHVEVSI